MTVSTHHIASHRATLHTASSIMHSTGIRNFLDITSPPVCGVAELSPKLLHTPHRNKQGRAGRQAGRLDDVAMFDVMVHLLAQVDLVHVDLGDLGVLAVEDLGDLLERGAAGFDVEEVDEDEFEGDPALWWVQELAYV